MYILDSNTHSLPKRSNSTVKQSVCVCLFFHTVILENAFHFLLNPLLVRTWVLVIKKLWQFKKKSFLVAEKSQYKVGRQLEISSLLLMSAENTKTLNLYL